jgi:hypothetical protein
MIVSMDTIPSLDSKTGIEQPIFISSFVKRVTVSYQKMEEIQSILVSIPTEIQITQSIVYFIAAAIPIYLTRILKKRTDRNNNNNSKYFIMLTIMLAGFVLMQGIYHSVGAIGFSLLAKGVLEPK